MDDRAYRNAVDAALESACVEIFQLDVDAPEFNTDAELIEHITKKFILLRKMLICTGLNEELLRQIINSK